MTAFYITGVIVLVNRLANNIIAFIHKHKPDASSYEVLRYGLVAIINQIIVTICVLAIALLTGHFLVALLCVFAFPLLRQFSGGIHIQSMLGCNIVTSCFILFSIYTPFTYWYNGVVLTITSLVILAIYAPSQVKHSRIPAVRRKIISLTIVGINLLLGIPQLAVLFFIQALTTTPLLQRAALHLNNHLRKE